MIWLYSLSTNKEGNYVRKPMRECTGEEVCQEWLYHIGIPEEEIKTLAQEACNTTTCFMPYINAFFQPRKKEDRPLVVPEGAVNFAFLGQFAETPRDTIFTTEYSIRTGMEAVYTLLQVDRGVPEVWGSKYDVRELLRACYYAVDKRPLLQMDLTLPEKEAVKLIIRKIRDTDLGILLKDSGLVEEKELEASEDTTAKKAARSGQKVITEGKKLVSEHKNVASAITVAAIGAAAIGIIKAKKK